MKRYKFKGCNDDHDTCDLCGKTGLKKVVWLVELDSEGDELGTPAPYGVCCAANLMGMKQTTRQRQTTAFDKMERERIEALKKDLMAQIQAKRRAIIEKQGLVMVDYFPMYPEDVATFKEVSDAANGDKFNPIARFDIIRRIKNDFPVFADVYTVEQMKEALASREGHNAT